MPVHPQVQAFLDLQAAAPAPPITEQTPDQARDVYRGLAEVLGQGPAVAGIVDRRIPGPAGEIPVRIYRPPGEEPFGVLVYYHGGGWVIGDLDTHDHVCRELCAGAGCVVAAVDYRLGPEHRFPAAVDDAFAALRWVAENAGALGGDPARLAVGGDSAGGNLAAVMSLKARDAGGPPLRLQLLIYPAVDMRFGYPSIDENGEGYVLSRDHMFWFRERYLASPEQVTHPDASPLLAASHAGLPPALVITAELDPLRDEGEAYGERLRAAGVPATVSRYEGMIHLFFQLSPMIEGGRRAVEQCCALLRSAFAL